MGSQAFFKLYIGAGIVFVCIAVALGFNQWINDTTPSDSEILYGAKQALPNKSPGSFEFVKAISVVHIGYQRGRQYGVHVDTIYQLEHDWYARTDNKSTTDELVYELKFEKGKEISVLKAITCRKSEDGGKCLNRSIGGIIRQDIVALTDEPFVKTFNHLKNSAENQKHDLFRPKSFLEEKYPNATFVDGK